jgi:hypothetical protein
LPVRSSVDSGLLIALGDIPTRLTGSPPSPMVALDTAPGSPFHPNVRRYLVGSVVAAIGGGFGWVSYWTQPPTMILATCDPVVTTESAVAAPPCVNTVIPLGLGGAVESLVVCATLALGIAGIVWLVMSQLHGRQATY